MYKDQHAKVETENKVIASMANGFAEHKVLRKVNDHPDKEEIGYIVLESEKTPKNYIELYSESVGNCVQFCKESMAGYDNLPDDAHHEY